MTIPPAKVVDWHESLADYMILRPHASLAELAAHFGVTTIWIGVVRSSDSFRELMRTRREVHAKLVSHSVIQKVEALAEQTVEELSKRMSEEKVPLDTVREIGDMALKSLGFGGRGGTIGPAGAIQQNVTVVVDREALAEARAKMLASNAPRQIELSAEEIADDSSS